MERRERLKYIDQQLLLHYRALGKIRDDRYTQLSPNADLLIQEQIRKLEEERAAVEADHVNQTTRGRD